MDPKSPTPEQVAAVTPKAKPATEQPTAAPAAISLPMTSIQDTGLSKRPRDARLIHMLLSSLGVTAYQERVPLQLLDFAYRHSSSILSDALHLSPDAYISQQTRARDAPPGGLKDQDAQVSSNAVQLAIHSRLQYQFSGGGGLSKEFLLETAQARNKVKLPQVPTSEWGVRLPSERFVLTGVPWGLREEWEQEEEDTVEGMDGVEAGEDLGMEDGGEEGQMEDLFGQQAEDHDMEGEE